MNSKPSKIDILNLRILLAIVCVVCFSFVSFSQETDHIVPIRKNPEKILKNIDVSEITRNGLTPWKNKFSGHYAGIDFGFNMFLNEDYSEYDEAFMENDVFRSNSFFFNLIQQSFGLQRNNNTFGLVTGLGLHLQNYRLDDNTTIERDDNDVIHPKYLVFDTDQKSKLAIVSLTVPLFVEWQIPVNHYDNRMYFSAGVQASLRLGSHTKIKYKTDKKQKYKMVDDFSMHTFKYALMFRTGYRWFNVFATYDLVPLFKTDKGPELIPFTVGITLLRF